MKFSGIFMIPILFLYQNPELDKAKDNFKFLLVFFGVILLIIILAYILLTSKQE